MPRVKNILEYVDYFRQMAVSHVAIKHNPLSEDGDAPMGSRKFYRTSAGEVLSALPKDIGFPMVTVELYDNMPKENNKYDIQGKFTGAFMVVDQANPKNFTEQLTAHATGERIVYQFLQKMWADHYGKNVNRQETPFKDIDFNGMDIVFVTGIFNGQCFGVRCEFNFEIEQHKKIATPPEAGVFE